MPPCTWMASPHTWRAASLTNDLQTEAAMVASSAPALSAQAA